MRGNELILYFYIFSKEFLKDDQSNLINIQHAFELGKTN